MEAKLILKDGSTFFGKSFGYEQPRSGELVFSTGMVGYPESLTDPSYEGQILVLTYPIIGNYGVPDKKFWESDRIHVSGLIISQYIDTPSHFQSQMTLGEWLKKEKVPALEIKDTRYLTQKLRDGGAQLAKIIFSTSTPSTLLRTSLLSMNFDDPNKKNLVAAVSTPRVSREGAGSKTVVVIDCGVKKNIIKNLLVRGVKVITVPWDYDIFTLKEKIDGVVISNGPGDPKMCDATIETVKKVMAKKIPLLGICLGNQILALAAGGNTYKMKFGHRGQNQPCIMVGTKKCYLTTQNHGFAIGKIPKGFQPWFINANDNTNEGIIHEKFPFMSVQFHPEACPGPVDTGWVFDEFLGKI
ncbi:MAG: Carbamoyl-phosphate synthase small chain [Candidatus Levybacteria bacterium GW2011_GWA2_37_36]|uniref:Carbamoyl phosphate synthase small chain n=1 Tax=Candidatus Roizmanbacteria bacterium GW2011_GWC2_34_23 TaxID=1618484 RepID=A0A0G0BGF1_9BACT|nr:MAG: Carbamoyl-phosphate synthase small chain [Candidatus Roizmanbacteria bacterium GW2011_GWC2_34_23]KKQ32768.1 MAG: Carbamoyl-phosphate synthase small chain [Candidatus Levybacteria bacterium GW2011_GWA2_37_36]